MKTKTINKEFASAGDLFNGKFLTQSCSQTLLSTYLKRFAVFSLALIGLSEITEFAACFFNLFVLVNKIKNILQINLTYCLSLFEDGFLYFISSGYLLFVLIACTFACQTVQLLTNFSSNCARYSCLSFRRILASFSLSILCLNQLSRFVQLIH